MSTTEFHCVNGTCDGKVCLFIKKLGFFESQAVSPISIDKFLCGQTVSGSWKSPMHKVK